MATRLFHDVAAALDTTKAAIAEKSVTVAKLSQLSAALDSAAAENETDRQHHDRLKASLLDVLGRLESETHHLLGAVREGRATIDQYMTEINRTTPA